MSCMGGRWISSAVQAASGWKISMATNKAGSSGDDTGTIRVAHVGTEHKPEHTKIKAEANAVNRKKSKKYIECSRKESCFVV